MACLYTVYRCQSLNSLDRCGPTHYSDDAEKTLCGKRIDHHWYVADNTFTGFATCRECVRIDARLHSRANALAHLPGETTKED